MRRAVAGVWDVPATGVAPALVVLSVCFFLGGVAGCVLAGKVDGGGSESLAAYLDGFLAVAGTEGVSGPALLPLIWEVVRWPLLTVLLGFTALGLLGIPILFLARGFLLSFAIASFTRGIGSAGGLMAAAVFGLSGLFSIPALFVLGVQGVNAARSLAGRALGEGKRSAPFGKAYFLRCGVCGAAFCVCVLLEYLAVPALVSGLAWILQV